MIFGRPTNLWTGLATALVGFLSILAVTVLKYDPTIVAQLSGAGALLLGALISLVANQPPTINSGGTVNVTTPAGQPNASATVSVAPSGDVTAVTQ